MTRPDKAIPIEEARELLHRARHGHLAGLNATGEPIVRALHHAILDERLIFHGRRGGEKLQMIGHPAVFACVEEITTIPSFFVDPRRACPATTYYRSVHVKGRLEALEDPDEKARALAALMTRLQPEGGYNEIRASAPEYAGAIAGLHMYALSIDELSGRRNIGANKTVEQMQGILHGLWKRGDARDLEAIELIRRERPGITLPFWPETPRGLLFRLTDPRPASRAQRIWLGVELAATGEIVAEVVAISDGRLEGCVLDLRCAALENRDEIKLALVRLLLDHAAMRRVVRLSFYELDASRIFEGVGFRGVGEERSSLILERSK